MIIRLTIALRIYGRTVGTRGRGVRGSVHPTSTKGGGIIPTTLLTPPPRTFRPSYGHVTANAMASGRMRCNGTLVFVAECYTTMEWNSFWWSILICMWVEFETHFFFINCMRSPQSATTPRRLTLFLYLLYIYVKMWMLHQKLFSLLCSRLCTGSTQNREFPLPHWSGLIFGFNLKFSQHKIKHNIFL